MASISNGPRIIQGSGEPGEYGRAAYRGLHQAEQDTARALHEQKSLRPLFDLLGTAVRYTPDETVKGKRLTEDGQKNLLGFANEFIETHDNNKDGALSYSDIYDKNEQMTKWRLEQIEYDLAHPQLSDEDRAKLEAQKKNLFKFLDKITEQTVKFMDLPDEKGEKDGLITRDEVAAHFLTQDNTLGALKKNYGDLKKEFQEKYPNRSWGWFQLKTGVGIALAQVISRLTGKEAPFKMDGRLSGPERFVSDIWSMVLPETAKKAVMQTYKEHDLKQYKP
jgi:hypothetical protein